MDEHATTQNETHVLTVGLDVGDTTSEICVIDAAGEVVERAKVRTTKEGLRRYFGARPPMLVALEAGGQSAWISRFLEELGHSVLVANPRRLRIRLRSPACRDATQRPCPPS